MASVERVSTLVHTTLGLLRCVPENNKLFGECPLLSIWLPIEGRVKRLCLPSTDENAHVCMPVLGPKNADFRYASLKIELNGISA